jgi:nitrite reductase (NO-forming)
VVADSGSGQQLTVRALDTMRFDPGTLNVPVGQPVQLTLKNDGALIHDLALSDGVAAPFTVEANGKASASATLTIMQPGTYTYVCAQPGHEAAGMKGTLVAR